MHNTAALGTLLALLSPTLQPNTVQAQSELNVDCPIPGFSILESMNPSAEFPGTPNEIVFADINLDGVQDIAILGERAASGSHIATYIARSPGNFAAPSLIALGQGFEAICIADVIGSPFPDFVATSRTLGTLSILEGSGTGGASQRLDLAAGSDPGYIAAGDLDSNGYTDLAVANVATGRVTVLLNSSLGIGVTGDFATGPVPNSMDIVNISGTSALDILVANQGLSLSTGNISVLEGSGSGTFSSPQAIVTGVNPHEAHAGHVDADGIIDIAYAPASLFAAVGTVRGLSGGGFGPPSVFSVGGVGTGIVRFTDFDGTAGGDIIAPVSLSSTISADSALAVLRRDAQTGLLLAPEYHRVGPGQVGSLAIGRLTADTLPDVSLIRSQSIAASFISNTNGGLSTSTFTFVGAKPNGVAVGDYDGNGMTDFAVTHADPPGANRLSVLYGSPTGLVQTNYAASDVLDVVSGNFDGLGPTDLVVLGRASKGVFVRLGSPQGLGRSFYYPTSSSARTAVAADLDADSDIDIAVGCLDGAVTVLLNDSTGVFSPTHLSPIPTAICSVDVGLLTGDSHLDIVLTSTLGAHLIASDGVGGFHQPMNLSSASSFCSLAVLDLDADGRDDVVCGESSGRMIHSILQVAPGVFADGSQFCANRSSDLIAGNFGGDSNLDLVSLSFGESGLTILHGDGRGGFDPPRQVYTGKWPGGITLIDSDGSTHSDFVVVNDIFGDMTVIRN